MIRLLRAIVDEAQQNRLPFLVIGGTAVNAFGHARLTLDLDLLIPRRDAELWTSLLEKLRYMRIPEQTLFAQFTPPLEGMWPVDLILVNQETFDKMSAEAHETLIDGIPVRLPSPLHLIAMKLHALRHGKREREAKDLTDVFELVRLNNVDVNNDAFRALCEKFGTTNCMSECDKPLESSPSELRETPARELEFPVPDTDLKSWRGTIDPAAALAFSETQLARFWSNPEFIRRRREQRIEVPFEL